MAALPDVSNRFFLPALRLDQLHLPAERIAEEVRIGLHLDGKFPWMRPFVTFYDEIEEAHVVGFPLSATEFLAIGPTLLMALYQLCDVTPAAQEGNEFLTTFPGGAPAELVFPAVYISDDGGATWIDGERLSFRLQQS